MKSKSFTLTESTTGKSAKLNRTFDFASLYKTAAETSEKLEKHKTENIRDGVGSKSKTDSLKKKKKKNEIVDVSLINIDGFSFSQNISNTSVNKVTSTPKAAQNQGSAVKSIMKNSSAVDDAMEGTFEAAKAKSKKRNKSVSFMLEDGEEIAVKKTKSDDTVKTETTFKKRNKDEKKLKKIKKNMQAEKENNVSVNMDTEQLTETVTAQKKAVKIKQTTTPVKKPKIKTYKNDGPADNPPDGNNQIDNPEKKRKLKKIKKRKKLEESEPTENDSNNNNDDTEHKVKKLKKKKRYSKPQTDSTETEGEPSTKSRKKDVKPEVITEDLENLSIGDNAHTLTNLLDEMTVVDKDKKKKNKLKRKKNKSKTTTSVSSSETAELEKIEEGKEKVKWKKRKWNKDKKGGINEESLGTTVIIENLPIKIVVTYKQLLSDHFGKLGLIKNVGIAEVYPTEEPKSVFTTTINFYSEGAATKALEEDNTVFEGSRIRVRAPLPPTQTTLVVRSYAPLSEQSLSSVFLSAGRIRNIRQLVKGKKAMATAFIEFDGPEAVERAIKMAEDAKIGGKKIHVSKFELRGARQRKDKMKRNVESENEGDSEDSND